MLAFGHPRANNDWGNKRGRTAHRPSTTPVLGRGSDCQVPPPHERGWLVSLTCWRSWSSLLALLVGDFGTNRVLLIRYITSLVSQDSIDPSHFTNRGFQRVPSREMQCVTAHWQHRNRSWDLGHFLLCNPVPVWGQIPTHECCLAETPLGGEEGLGNSQLFICPVL